MPPTSLPSPSLTFIVTDLYVPAQLRESEGSDEEPRVPLPALERWMARGSAAAGSDWREYACGIADLAVAATTPAGGVPVAAVAMAALSRRAPDPAEQWWVVTPVHLSAAHDHVKLAEIVALEPHEWGRLLDRFDRDFGSEFGRLQEGSAAEAYLLAPRRYEAVTVDPAQVVGRDVHDSLPRGADGGMLRRLMTELQMWLHEDAINAARETKGTPPVNGLWVWGGGTLTPVNGHAPLPQLYSDDRFLRGLWSLRGAEAHTLSAIANQRSRFLQARTHDVLVALAVNELRAESWLQRLSLLDSEWLAPAIGSMRSGGPKTARLLANDKAWTLRARDLWRVWRQPRPWLEVLA